MKKISLSALILFTCINSCFAQWGQVNNGITNLTSGAKLLGNSNTHLFAGTLGGYKMYRTNDNGNNWIEIQPPVASNVPECGYYFSGKYFSGLNSSMNCIFYTDDNGTTWNSVTGGPQTTVVRGFISLSGIIFAYTSSAGIYKSSDGGLTWSTANSGLTNLNVIGMETINTKLIAATIGGGVFISADNGATWVQSNTGITGGDLNTELVWKMGSNLYYIAQGGGSYSSNNEGTTWSNWTKPSVMGLAVLEIHRNGSNIYMEARHFSGGLRDSIYMTSNEGASWTNITANLSASDLNASGITEFNGYTFIAYNLISPGQGIYRRGTPVGLSDNDLSNSFIMYPNPFDDRIFLPNLSKETLKQISIYDSQGKKVLSENSNINFINTLELNNGLYIIELIFSDNTTVHKKLIKVSTNR